MIQGGNTTIYVKDIEVSIRFYTDVLGLKLRMRAGDNWAEIDAGPGLVIGLHPTNPPHTPKAGTRGSLAIGFNVTEDVETVMEKLTKLGISFQGPVVDDGNVRLAFFSDPDGNPLYLAQVLYAGAHGGPPE